MQFFPSVYFVYFFHFVKHFQYSKSTHFDFSETHKRNEQNKYRIKNVFFLFGALNTRVILTTRFTHTTLTHTYFVFFLFTICQPLAFESSDAKVNVNSIPNMHRMNLIMKRIKNAILRIFTINVWKK